MDKQLIEKTRQLTPDNYNLILFIVDHPELLQFLEPAIKAGDKKKIKQYFDVVRGLMALSGIRPEAEA